MPSEHFDGKYYFNQDVILRPLWQVFYWMLTRKRTKWPTSVPVQQCQVEKARLESNGIVVTFITHSTLLIQMGKWNILTDPIWSERAGPFNWLGPKRVAAPGVKFEDLPPIDIVLVSHNHYDHMDLPTLRLLEKHHKPLFYVPMGNKSFLEREGLAQVRELDWWEEIAFSEHETLIFVPAQHFSSRSLGDRNRTLWGGFVLKGIDQVIYFAGDSGYGKHFKEIATRCGNPTLACLPIGAYKPRWLMQSIHLSPQEAVQAHLDLNAKQSLAIHFGTFPLADEGIDEPVKSLHIAMHAHQLPIDQFWTLKPGESKKVN
ncbi:hypothetical protein PNK_0981 [Candidatus Protochlamydia naegleriophila]|uniref:Metallo-beta-lactamase domain-containing protein n=1 Tax=Candidatus Protochlamydia naegleriophila TaxID=389348 RepID=A0A0U5JB02_9BACT|nr:MBL fold metallo-hydrolase [Candidatus Protochlamydia naegleriophila]CUI16606.1 hypothetical protein PNK_0981 [Candidatus Protochlamydia naegleriophila]